MTDETISTVVDTGTDDLPSNVVAPATPDNAPEHKPGNPSPDDAIAKALDKAEADHAAKEAEAPAEVKEEAKEKPQPVEKVAKEEAPKEDAEQKGNEEAEVKAEAKPKDDKGQIIQAPDKFLPTAKEQWVNVPRAVRSEVMRLTTEHEAEVEQYRAKTERYESIREFDELAKSNGIELRDSLARVSQLEDLMQSNPLAGINSILMQAGPRKADGQPVSLYELATAIVQMGPEGYQRSVAQQPQRQQDQGDPRVNQLEQQIASMRAEQAAQTIIAPFAAEHPRYNEPAVQKAIAFFLNSDMVPTSLPPQERLAAAYDYAVRINPSTNVESAASETSEQAERRAGDFGGSRSIKGAPPTGSNGSTRTKRKMSRDDAIDAAMAALQ